MTRSFDASRTDPERMRDEIKFHYDRAASVTPTHRQWTLEEMGALAVLNDMKRIVRHRSKLGHPIGNIVNFVTVVADIDAALRERVTPKTVEARCLWIEISAPLDIIDPIASRAAAMRRSVVGPYRMMSGELVGHLVELSAEERTNLGIKRIGSFDESPKQRKRRLNRERQSRHREAQRLGGGASARPRSASGSRPWEQEGVSKSTWYKNGNRISDQDVTISLFTESVTTPVHFPGKRYGNSPSQRYENSPTRGLSGKRYENSPSGEDEQ